MKHLWITVGNSDFDRKRLNLANLPYPLASYAPATAISKGNDNVVLPKNRYKCEIGVELAFKVKHDLFRVDDDIIKESIDGYYLCISLSDYFHLKSIMRPNSRDIGVCEYYSRWNDRSNCLVRLRNFDWKKIQAENKKPVKVNNVLFEAFHYTQSPHKIAKFLSSFTRLYKDTIICLGQVGRLPYHESGNNEINVNYLNIDHIVKIKGS